MRQGWWWLLGAQAALAGSSLPAIVPGLGEPTWHHNASLAATLALVAAVVWRTRDPRRHLSLSVALWTFLALLSGFVLLYLKQDLKAIGWKDWAKFWHIAWSWLALWTGVLHLWWNRHGLLRSIRRSHASPTPAMAFDATWIAVLVAIPLTWSAWGADNIQEHNFILLTLWTVIAVVGGSYILWWGQRMWRPAWADRPATQAFVDTWLLPAFILANLSGFPLLYAGTKDTALKYVAKYWHVWPSIVMLVLVLAHTVQFLPGLVAHYRRQV